MSTRQGNPGATGSGSPRLIKAAEVAALVAISTRTLWRLVSVGRFPEPVRVGGSTRWRLADVERWIQQGCTDSRNDQQ